MTKPQSPIRVKFLTRQPARMFRRQLPGDDDRWGECRFLFDPDAPDYDWLVVYDDLPPVGEERFSTREEWLPGPRRHSLLVTTEPPNIKAYGRAYTAQFGCVLTSHPPWALPHPDRIYQQPALQWFYGIGADHEIGYDALAERRPGDKPPRLSTVCSQKTQKHTLHARRHAFTWALKERLPELEIFGHGVQEMDDKAESLDDFRYHLAIENYAGAHHWTEKLADPFLAWSLPFYFGATNASDYFPADSFIPIDIDDVAGAAATIRTAIADDAWRTRLPAIAEARRRVLEDFNIFAVLAREIARRHDPARPANGARIVSRRLANRRTPLTSLAYLVEKTRSRVRHAREQNPAS